MAIGTPTVRGTAAATTSSTTLVVTLSSGVSIGDTVIIYTGGRSFTPASAVDSRGNTYSLDASFTDADANNGMGFLSAPVTTALLTSDTVTITFAGSVGPSSGAIVLSVSGLAASAFDKASAGLKTDVSAAGPHSFNCGPTGVLAQADEVVFGGFTFFAPATGGGVGITPGSGFTALQYVSSSGAASSDRPSWVEYKIVAATTSVTPDASVADNAVTLAGGISAAYKAGAGGGGGATHGSLLLLGVGV